MIVLLIRFCRALAAAFGAFADSLSQSAAPIVEPEPRFEPGEQTRMAQQLAAEMKLRGFLMAALQRYSPEQPPIEA